MTLPFLTKYDPTEIPGGTIDPLGFFLPYMRLADEWIPGLTNAADQPRYCSMLCRGALIASKHSRKQDLSGIEDRKLRLEIIKRYERIWVLACTIALGKKAEGMGLRGITYAQTELMRSRARTDYTLLGNQLRYGAIGMYAPMSIALELLTKDYVPEARGVELANVFPFDPEIDELAVQHKDGSISKDKLLEWGRKVRVGKLLAQEKRILRDALNSNPKRKIALNLLETVPRTINELDRLRQIRVNLSHTKNRTDLEETRVKLLDVIARFEYFYNLSISAFNLIRWNATKTGSGWNSLSPDNFLSKQLPIAKKSAETFLGLKAAMQFVFRDTQASEIFRSPIELAKKTQLCSSASEWVNILVGHHKEVQHGRFGESTEKAAWLFKNNDLVFVGANRYKLNTPVTSNYEIEPHSYKSLSADNFIGLNLEHEKI